MNRRVQYFGLIACLSVCFFPCASLAEDYDCATVGPRLTMVCDPPKCHQNLKLSSGKTCEVDGNYVPNSTTGGPAAHCEIAENSRDNPLKCDRIVGGIDRDPCTGPGVCALGGQLRLQVGDDRPFPFSIGRAETGFVTSQAGIVAATTSAQVTLPAGVPGNRSLTIQPGALTYDGPEVRVAVFDVSPDKFSIRTNLDYSWPNNVLGPAALYSGGRTGPPVVTWCAGSGAPTTTFNPGCLGPNTTGSGSPTLTNGLVRYTATRNQFGGVARARVLGSAMAYFNVAALSEAQLPCNGAGCLIGIADRVPLSAPAAGGSFGAIGGPDTYVNPTGVFTASIGSLGSILATGMAVTSAGVPIPFVGETVTSWGMPFTTGMLTISVTQNFGTTPEIFIRTGTDGRDANGDGVVSMVGGSLSARSLSGPSAGRAWLTIAVPEAPVLGLSLAGLVAIASAHHARRLNRRH